MSARFRLMKWNVAIKPKHIFLIVRWQEEKKAENVSKNEIEIAVTYFLSSLLLIVFFFLCFSYFFYIFWRVWLSLMYLWYLLVHVVKRMGYSLFIFYSVLDSRKCLWPFFYAKTYNLQKLSIFNEILFNFCEFFSAEFNELYFWMELYLLWLDWICELSSTSKQSKQNTKKINQAWSRIESIKIQGLRKMQQNAIQKKVHPRKCISMQL